MPVQSASVRMLATWITILIEVGQHVDFRVLFVAVVLAEDVDLHLTEIAREGDLSCRRQIDITEQDQFVVEKSFIDFSKHRRRHCFLKRDAGDLAPKNRVQRCDPERPIAGRASRFNFWSEPLHTPGRFRVAETMLAPIARLRHSTRLPRSSV